MKNVYPSFASLLVLSALLLTGCGGGGGGGGSSEPSAINSVLQATVVYQPSLKSLDDKWSGDVILQSPNILVFSGDPGLAIGDVFILDGAAYKVDSIGGNPPETRITYVEPDLSEIYSTLKISGDAEISEDNFILDTAVRTALKSTASSVSLSNHGTDASNRQGALVTPSAPNIGDWSVTKEERVDGENTLTISGMTKVKENIILSGSFLFGARFLSADWEPITGGGRAQLDVRLSPQALLSLKSKEKLIGGESDACSAKGVSYSSSRIRLGTVKFRTNIPSLTINTTLCVSLGVTTEAAIDLIEIKNDYRATLKLGNYVSPILTHSNNFDVSLPATKAKISKNKKTPASIGTLASRMSTSINVALALEPTLELEALRIFRLGAMLQAGVKGQAEGSVSYNLLDTLYSNVVDNDSACLNFKAHLFASPKLIGSVGWDKPSKLIESTDLSYEYPLYSKDYGHCKCPDGSDLLDRKNGACPPIDAHFNSTDTFTQVINPGSIHKEYMTPSGPQAADLFCTSKDAVGDISSDAERWELNAKEGTAKVYFGIDDAVQGLYNSETGSLVFSTTVSNPTHEITPVGYPVKYFQRETFSFIGNYDVLTQTITGDVYEATINSWELDSQEAKCSTIATYVGHMSDVDKSR